jgi:transcriptional regulator with XRE-family HTH domain
MTRKRTTSARPPIRVADLGESIQRKRGAEDLTLRDAAQQTGIGASTLWRLEKGQGVPDAATLARLGGQLYGQGTLTGLVGESL